MIATATAPSSPGRHAARQEQPEDSKHEARNQRVAADQQDSIGEPAELAHNQLSMVEHLAAANLSQPHQQDQAPGWKQRHHNFQHGATQRPTLADECEDKVKQVDLFGVRIVALIINGKERLCLAQISNTLLKEFSYNEIHNRRVALGITCVQCTPIQLEMLRRAGAMPSSSRRCGMITMREAERLCRSFLIEEQPPELPENFFFTVAHRINYGCKGRFIPARYISSRAKCIECFYCGEFYSPNKFIFHSHRQPHATDCNPPDSPNINSWRKHIDLDQSQEQGQDIKYAWEDVKSLFNGGTRRRAPMAQPSKQAVLAPSLLGAPSDEDQHVDVECEPEEPAAKPEPQVRAQQARPQAARPGGWQCGRANQAANSLIQANQRQLAGPAGLLKRPANEPASSPMPPSKRFSASNLIQTIQRSVVSTSQSQAQQAAQQQQPHLLPAQVLPHHFNQNPQHLMQPRMNQQRPASSLATFQRPLGCLAADQPAPMFNQDAKRGSTPPKQLVGVPVQPAPHYPSPHPSFNYSQLYNQLVQSNQDIAQPQQQPQDSQQQQQQQQQQLATGYRHQQHFGSPMDAQLALRHHLWLSLLANLQANPTSGTSIN